MLNVTENSKTHIQSTSTQLSLSFIKFCSALSCVTQLDDFLLTINSQFPKKFKTVELLLFYESKPLGLRRAYVKQKRFYEQTAKQSWPKVDTIRLSSKSEKLYLAQEFGRPFFKTLLIPLFESKALLILELGKTTFVSELIEFFESRKTIINLAFKRVCQNASLHRISYLWSQLFFHWEEPLAFVKNFKILRQNNSFNQKLPKNSNFFKNKQISNCLKVGKKTYQLYYYPLTKELGILYAQDMSNYFLLKEHLFQLEKMTALYELGKNMSHQLNNPLTGVKAMTQILKKNPELKSFQQEFQELEKAIDRTQTIMKSLLSFSEIKGQIKNCDLNQILNDTLPLLKSVTKKVRLEKNFYKKSLTVRGNFTLFQQMIYNLILNACQALAEDTQNKTPTLSITTDKISEDKMCLRIKDNGIGIPKENLEKIFQPLWTNKKQGSGFGLGITKKFIKSSGGEIFVSSKQKEFTCFTILFPLYHPENLFESVEISL